MLAPPGTIRVLLASSYYEMHPEARPNGGPAIEDIPQDTVREHLRRLQGARLLAHTGSYDIERQAGTNARRELWPVWTSAVLAARSLGVGLGPDRRPENVAITVERVVHLAAAPSTFAAARQLRDGPAFRQALAAALHAADATELAAHLPLGPAARACRRKR
ncbi:hypothetical protein [Kitasatospora sp. NPDC057015]|uniref:hypothetical protein n=1 Tax=Kitasatospora sp. NPDC057015 TaxID=3346001 RepID=UPI003644861D